MSEKLHEPTVGVTFGGGGYRAAAFSLGALLCIFDLTRDRRAITSIASVSGGSITNAFAASQLHDKEEELTQDEYWQRASTLADLISNRSILPRSVVTAVDVALVLFATTAVSLCTFFILERLSWPRQLIVLPIGLVLLAALYAYYMGHPSIVASRLEPIIRNERMKSTSTYAARPRHISLLTYPLYYYSFRVSKAKEEIKGRFVPLDELRPLYRPVFCTTDLASATHLYISDRFVAASSPDSQRRGETPSIDLAGNSVEMSISKAVMASAAFPGAFHSVKMRATELGLPARIGLTPKYVRLADGGLYDNLGWTFFYNLRERALPEHVLNDISDGGLKQYIVVNCGLADYSPVGGLLHTFKRSMVVVHHANTNAHLQSVKRVFGESENLGALVSIGDNPFNEILGKGDDRSERRKILGKVLEKMQQNDQRLTASWWQALSQEVNPGIATNLRRLGSKDTSRLMFHGYVATLAKAVVYLGWDPPGEIPTLARFESMCQ